MRLNLLLITIVLVTAVVASAIPYAQPAGKLGGTGVGVNNPANTGSGVLANPGAGANAGVDNEQAQSAPVTRDPGSGIAVTIPFGGETRLGTPPSEEASEERRKR